MKRLASIEEKLKRYDWLTLSSMQDIAGTRVIVSDVDTVHRLVTDYKRGYSSHILDSEDDYIDPPKADGYRGYHLIYRYSDAFNPAYNGLKVEMQFRSALQHAWATAVETADIFYREGLKAHRGSPEWRRFFALMGSAMALREGCRRVPRTPANESQLVAELKELAESLNVRTRLKAFGSTIRVVSSIAPRQRGMKYVILVLDPAAGTTQLFGYRAGQIDEASTQLRILEQHKSAGSDAVLVSVSDAAGLRRAYPNYFLDTDAFLAALDEACG